MFKLTPVILPIRRIQSVFAVWLLVGVFGCSSASAKDQKYKVSDAGYASVKRAPAVLRDAQSVSTASSIAYALQYAIISQRHQAKAKALKAQLEAKYPKNFVEYRLVWEPEFHYLFSFLEDAEVTLAKYTSNPIFKPNTVKYPAATLEAKSGEIGDALNALYPEYNLENLSSIDIIKGKVIVYLSLYEEDFETFPTLDAFRNDPMVELNYNGPLDPAEVLSAEVKPLIRHLAHGPVREPIVVSWSFTGKILLKDGCFYLDDGKRKDQLLIFARSVGVVLDDEGYIALIDRSPHPGNKTTTRVGEPAQWISGPTAVTDPEILTPLQTACGQNDAVIISAPSPR